MFFLEKKLVGWGSKGEEEEDGKAEVVAHEIAYQPYGDAEDGEVFVVEECGDEGYERGGVDECHGGDEGGVAVEVEESCKEYLDEE